MFISQAAYVISLCIRRVAYTVQKADALKEQGYGFSRYAEHDFSEFQFSICCPLE